VRGTALSERRSDSFPESIHMSRPHPSRGFARRAFVLASAASAPALADGQGILPLPDYRGDFASRTTLTGDWDGHRTALAEKGFTLDLSFTQLAQDVVDGGAETGTRYGGKIEALINLDLDRMGAVPGGLVTIRTESRYGQSANTTAGTLLPVSDTMYFPLTNPADEDIAATVTELLYTQFLSREVGLLAGKFTILGADSNEFAGGRGDTQFLGHPFTSASVTSLFNPYSALGTGAFVMPTPELTVSSSLYTSTDSSTTSGFDTLDDGLVWSSAIAWQYRLGELPGGVRATYQHAFDRNFVNFSGRFITRDGIAIPVDGDSWCAFANAWQYIAVEEAPTKPINVGDGRTDLQGVGLFLRAGTADPDTNPIEWIVSGGIAAKGLLPGRDRDTLGVGYAYSHTSDLPFVTSFVVNDTSSRLEAYYDLALTPAAELTFDVQVADSLLASNSTATVLGLRLRLDF
jgi:porin